MLKINKLNSLILPNFKRLLITNRYYNTNITNISNNDSIIQPSSIHMINNIQTINTTTTTTTTVPLQQQQQQQIIKTPEQTLKIPTLIGNLVTLRPLNRNDRDELLEASKEGELWNMKLTIVPGPNTIDKYIDTAFTPGMMPFVIINNKTGRIIGTTRYWKVDLNHKRLEIGHTWLSLSSQKTGINTECKYLLLKYAFEEMNSIRVQFTTDELNENSKRAILRIGAKLEGTVRNERIMPDGRKRNSLRFSIIDSEWENVKLNLKKMMN